MKWSDNDSVQTIIDPGPDGQPDTGDETTRQIAGTDSFEGTLKIPGLNPPHPSNYKTGI